MSDSITIARPYAKAIFEHALSAASLDEWFDYLSVLACAVTDCAAREFIDNPSTTVAQQTELLLSVIKTSASQEQTVLKSFIELLAINKRLTLLPDIYTVFSEMKALQEKTLVVYVTSFTELNAHQQQSLIASLNKRLARLVSLVIVIDKTLLGGAVIKAGDLVIDGSVRGKLNKLRMALGCARA